MGQEITTINAFLVKAFNHIIIQEYHYLSRYPETKDLSMVEIHLIEAVVKLSKDNSNTANNIAAYLHITPGTLTTSVNTLIKKGMLNKKPSEVDKRKVYITPTDAALIVNQYHEEYHQHLVDFIIKNYSEEEKKVLADCLDKIDTFFFAEGN